MDEAIISPHIRISTRCSYPLGSEPFPQLTVYCFLLNPALRPLVSTVFAPLILASLNAIAEPLQVLELGLALKEGTFRAIGHNSSD